MKKIAVFASGNGSNACRLMDYFKDSNVAEVTLIVSNKKSAPVVTKAHERNTETLIISKQDLADPDNLTKTLKEQVDFIVLAGFMMLVPPALVKAFEGRMINIHPALLPDYGGKGMYGKHVHEAVLKNGETVSGITIHYVNEEYDKGRRIFQAKCPVYPGEDTAETLAERIHKLEHMYFPVVTESVLQE